MATKVVAIGTAVQVFLRTLTAEMLESLLRMFVRSLSGVSELLSEVAV
jgi:hypothetical protein